MVAVLPRRSSASGTVGVRLAHAIEERITTDRWQPGHLIGSEAELCQMFGVGTASLREATRILEERGVVKAKRGPGGGLFVSVPERSLVTDAARRYLSHAGVERRDLFEAWQAMEQLAVAKLAATIDEEGAAQLRAMLAEQSDQRPRDWLMVPNIHLEIARQSGNVALELFIGVLCELSMHTYGPTTEPDEALDWLHRRHEEIVEAIIGGDAALAQLRLRRYIDVVKQDDSSPVRHREGN